MPAILRRVSEPDVGGGDWDWISLAEIAAEMNSPNCKGDSKKGVKGSLVFDFIPLHHFLPLLLHIIPGIWNKILDTFWEIVSEAIKYIPQEEVDLQGRKEL